MIDLHTHSTESDGTLTPQELMQLAADTGLSAIALTDHDTVTGLEKARPIAQALGVELVPGIELSTNYNGTEVHILGFYIDDTSTAFLAKLQKFLDSRELRNEKMAFALQKEGFDISLEKLQMEYPKSVITRAHFARYLVEQGFIKNRETVFRKYLGDNCRCYVPREKITPFEAIDLINQSGGLAFFAHPVLCHMNHDRLRFFIRDLKSAGLTGIEAIYSMNSPGDERNMKKFAKEFDLLISGGSDFHGENKPYIHLGTGKGNLKIPDTLLDIIKNDLP